MDPQTRLLPIYVSVYDPSGKGMMGIPAIIDTGAEMSFISIELASRLNIPQVGPPRLQVGNEIRQSWSYAVGLGIQFNDVYFPIGMLIVDDWPAHKARPHHFIVGMDLISMGKLRVERPGLFEFSLPRDSFPLKLET